MADLDSLDNFLEYCEKTENELREEEDAFIREMSKKDNKELARAIYTALKAIENTTAKLDNMKESIEQVYGKTS